MARRTSDFLVCSAFLSYNDAADALPSGIFAPVPIPLHRPMSPEERVPLLFKAIYGSGEWCGAVTATARSLFLNYFLVTVVGVNINSVGRILFVGRVWDALNDPMVGMISDRFHSSWGRRRPLMLAAALPLGLSFAVLWWRPGNLEGAGLVLYFLVVSIVLDTVLTLFAVPHTALLAELTDDYNTRINYTVWRNAFFILGALIVGVTFKLLAEDFLGQMGEQSDVLRGYMLTGWIFGGSLLIAPILIVAVVNENPNVQKPTERNPLRLFRQAFSNGPFRMLSAAYFLAFSGLEILVVTFVWYLNIVLAVPSPWDNAMIGVLLSAALISLPLINVLVRRWGKKRSYIIISVVWCISMPVLAVFPGGNLPWLVVFFIWLGTLYSAGITIPWTMLPDVLEYDELKTGTRSEGLFTAYLVFFRKLGSAVVTLLANFVLGRAGFEEGTFATQIAQPESVHLAMRLLIGIVPTVLVLGSIVFIRRYPITRTYHEALKRQLRTQNADGPPPART